MEHATINQFDEQSGATTIEYSLMLLLIFVVCVAIVAVIGAATNNLFSLFPALN